MISAETSGQIPYNIMVVEYDDRMRIEMVEVLLQKGFEVIGEKNGHMAEKVASRFKPELFVIALDLPRLYGNHLVRKFRSDEQYQKIPIITLTPQVDKRQIAHMQDFNIKDILIKPLLMEKFIKVVEKYYRMKVIVEISKDD